MSRLAVLARIVGLSALMLASSVEGHDWTSCTASLYVKPRFQGQAFIFSAGLSDGTLAKALLDFTQLHPTAAVPKWDDKVQSVKLSCGCIGSDGCQFSPYLERATLRLFADPYWRQTQGGNFTDLKCTDNVSTTTYAYLTSISCSGGLAIMPVGWNGRTSAAAILFNTPTYRLPLSRPSDDPMSCPRRSGYTVYASTAWQAAAGSSGGQRSTAQQAEALCNSDPACTAWSSNGAYLMGPIRGYVDSAGVCSYVKLPAGTR